MSVKNILTQLLAIGFLFSFSPKATLAQDTLSMSIDEAIDWMEVQIIEGGKQRKWKSIYFQVNVKDNFNATLNYKVVNEMGLLDEFKYMFYLNDLATMDDKVFSGHDDLAVLTKLDQKKIILERKKQVGNEKRVKERIETYRRISMVTLPMPRPEISWQAKEVIKQLISISEKDEMAKLEKDKIDLENELIKIANKKYGDSEISEN